MQLNCLFKARDPSRAVIALKGKGVKDFLQGLYTNDVLGTDTARMQGSVNAPPPFSRGTTQYGCFLSGTGRTLFDGFITDISLKNSEEVKNDDSGAKQQQQPAASAGGLAPPPSTAALPVEMVLVDVAASVKDLAISHFNDFKLRRKIKIVDVSSHVNVIVETVRTAPKTSLYMRKNEKHTDDMKIIQNIHYQQAAVDEDLVACDDVNNKKAPLMVLDPRHTIAVEGSLGDFSEPSENCIAAATSEGVPPVPLPPPLPMALRRGYRVLSPAELEEQAAQDREACVKQSEGSSGNVFDANKSNIANIRAYRALVESLCGIPSGTRTFLPNKGLPFEGNIDQLWGVSFEKGCYLGQELTHRTHVMLVCRKRAVPIVLGHFNTREEILAITGGLGGANTDADAKSARLHFDVDSLSLSGVDFSIPRLKVWGEGLKHDVEYIIKTSEEGESKSVDASFPSAPQKAAPNPALTAVGHKLYFDPNTSSASGTKAMAPQPSDPKALQAVGHVTQGQYNVGAGLLRLRYMDPTTRTMKLYIKRDVTSKDEESSCETCYGSRVPEYVPCTAFIPLWWAEEVVEKVLSAAEASE